MAYSIDREKKGDGFFGDIGLELIGATVVQMDGQGLRKDSEQGSDDVIEMNSIQKNVMDKDGKDISFDPTGQFKSELDEWSQRKQGQVVARNITWENLDFGIVMGGGGCVRKTPKTEKQILHNCSGSAYASEMLAIMGASGAGKTTLLNLLAGRMTSSSEYFSRGKICVNDKKRKYSTFRKYSAYVMQDDDLFADLTVTETIRFAAFLRLPKSMSDAEKIERSDSTIRELGLEKCKDTKIGSEIVRGISGGERKRVTIGVELVTNPSLLFLDEPTTGLDSFNALNVITTLRKLCSNNRTILTTIHQPRSNIYQLFDNLMLLSEGKVAYFGGAQEAVKYFNGLGFKCPNNFNPADYFIDLLSMNFTSHNHEDVCKLRIKYLGDQFAKINQGEQLIEDKSVTQKSSFENDGEVYTVNPNPDADGKKSANFVKPATASSANNGIGLVRRVTPSGLSVTEEDNKTESFEQSFFNEFKHISIRAGKLIIRERKSNMARFFQTLFFSVLLGLIWLNQGRDYADNPTDPILQQNLQGILFFIVVNISFSSVFGVLFIYPLERSIVIRERSSGTYRVSSYFLSKNIMEFPRSIFYCTIQALIIYWMVGLVPTAACFFYYYIMMIMVTLVAEGVTLAVVTCIPDIQTASAIIPALVVMSMLFGGYFIQSGSIPKYLIWLEYLSFVKYSFQGLAINQIPSLKSQAGYDLTAWEYLSVVCAFAIFLRCVIYICLRYNGPKFDRSI